jgi:hypothetical protein
VALAIVALLIVRNFNATSNTTVMPIVGGMVMTKSAHFRGLSVWMYTTGDVNGVMDVEQQLYSGSQAIVIIADINPESCLLNRARMLAKPVLIEPRDTYVAVDTMDEQKIYAIAVQATSSDKPMRVVCSVTVAPGRPSYISRVLQFRIMTQDYAVSRAFPGFSGGPERAYIYPIANPDVRLDGATAVHNVRLYGGLFPQYDVTDGQPLTAYWTSVQASGKRDTWLFFAAALFGIAASLAIESARQR